MVPPGGDTVRSTTRTIRQDATVTTSPHLAANDVLVQVGDGGKAHVFRTLAHANAKRFALADGGTAYDIVMCGARGALMASADDAVLCASCRAALERVDT